EPALRPLRVDEAYGVVRLEEAFFIEALRRQVGAAKLAGWHVRPATAHRDLAESGQSWPWAQFRSNPKTRRTVARAAAFAARGSVKNPKHAVAALRRHKTAAPGG